MYKYSISTFWSEEDQAFISIIPDIPELSGISAFGDTPEESVHELQICLDGVLESFKEKGWDIPEPKRYTVK